MSEKEQVKGSCLCGSVTLSSSYLKNTITACHCGMCRKWGGGPYMEVSCGDDVQIEGQELVATYDSSEWAERCFCKQCGTHLFYRLKETKEHMIPVGFFGDTISPKFDLQVFIDRKPDYYSFSNETKVMTEAEIFERYSAKS